MLFECMLLDGAAFDPAGATAAGAGAGVGIPSLDARNDADLGFNSILRRAAGVGADVARAAGAAGAAGAGVQLFELEYSS
eukprot:gene4249-14362_t